LRSTTSIGTTRCASSSKIFARLTAWQNWIFQRPNAIGEDGALKRYGTGQKPVFDTKRV
jgi:benzoyl-CoA-dihydrodiol lyase